SEELQSNIMEFINAPIGRNNLSTKSHPKACYTSRLLDFTSKKLNEILESENSQAYHASHSDLNDCIIKDLRSLGICHGFISDKQAILESGQNIEEINFNIKNPIITTRKRRPVEREIEYINKYLKTHINFENERLLPIPQSPIANEAVVHEISRQLGNWNVETGQNGIVTTSQGGYNFSVSGQKKIRAPHIAFIPENIYSSLNKTQLLTFLGQPFTPIFVAEVVNVSKEAIFNEVDIRFKNEMYEKDDDDENITHQKCKWEDLDSDNILPDFTLDIEFVEKIILQKYEDDELLIEEVKENEDKGEKPMKKI
ncbi:17592_t:CDS:2, partial [Rhizophagus irregularis]